MPLNAVFCGHVPGREQVMRAEEFAECLRSAMPATAVLEQHGLSAAEVAEIQATFMAPRRALVDTEAERAGSEVLRLARLFDCSRMEVGLVRFQAEVSAHARGLCFARLEGEQLVLSPDGTIAAYEGESGSGRACAQSGAHFLDALAEFVKIRHARNAWKGRVSEAAEKCAQAGGGIEFVDCYRSICAFLES